MTGPTRNRTASGVFASVLAPLLALALMLSALPAAAAAQSADGFHGAPGLTEWEVPYEQSRPRDPFVGPDGHVFFVGQRTHYVGRLDPESGEFTKWDLEDGTGPHNLIVDADGIVWYAGNRARHIGRLDPATGEITKFVVPNEAATDPHTLIWAPDGTIWFTVQGGNFVGHFDPSTGEYGQLVEMPQAPGRGGQMGSTRPYGIKHDSEGRPWIALFNTNAIASVDPTTYERTVYRLPDEQSRPRRLVVDSNDDVWYVDYSQGRLGKLDTESGDIREWPLPGGEGARPYGMAIDAADRIWFVETGIDPNHFVGFDPRTEAFFSRVPVESGGGTIRHMYYEPESNTVWFGTDTNNVGRAVLPPLRPVTSQ